MPRVRSSSSRRARPIATPAPLAAARSMLTVALKRFVTRLAQAEIDLEVRHDAARETSQKG